MTPKQGMQYSFAVSFEFARSSSAASQSLRWSCSIFSSLFPPTIVVDRELADSCRLPFVEAASEEADGFAPGFDLAFFSLTTGLAVRAINHSTTQRKSGGS